MRNITLLVLILLLVLIVATHLNRTLDRQIAHLVSQTPCDEPIKYRVDTVDSKFGLTRDDFTNDIKAAAQIWDQALGKDLFIYDPNGQLSINLIFDERQSINNQISQLENQLQTQKNQLKPEIDQFNKMVADFKTRLTNLNNEIAFWNKRGGAPEDVYRQLIKEQQDLNVEADKLNQMAKALNQSQDNYNVNVVQLNQEINSFNQELVTKPEEGIYKGGEDRIEIYFNISRNELLHTLAHEMGHAIGIAHTADPKSIMYPNTTEEIIAKSEDVQALKSICKLP